MSIKLVLLAFLQILLLNYEVNGQESPCPNLFVYESPPKKVNGRWYGITTLLSDVDLDGIWLRLIFDEPSLRLGNWFGEVLTTNNKEYLVRNRKYKLTANTPYPVRFFIDYDPSKPIPRLVGFRLNAKSICPDGQSSTTTSPPNVTQLFTDKEPDVTPSILLTTQQPPNTTEPTSLPPASEDDGDLSGKVSPCPRLFLYEPSGVLNNRWYGIVTLMSDIDLNGIWLRLIFDRRSLRLGNWFGEVSTADNQQYLVKNRTYKLAANTPYPVRFFIEYDPDQPVPRLTSFRLNAKTVCPEGYATTQIPPTVTPLFTHKEPNATTQSWQQGYNPIITSEAPPTSSLTEDDIYFPGDFNMNVQSYSNPDTTNAKESPCPRLFIYEPSGKETDRWYGVLTLLSVTDLYGIWITLTFDRPSLELKLQQYWFGEVLTRNKREYLIKNTSYNLTANTLHPLRFYVKYNPGQPVPRLLGFRLNTKIVCPDGQNGASVLFTNKQSEAALVTVTKKQQKLQQSIRRINKQTKSSSLEYEDDDNFPGDFNLGLEKTLGVITNIECGTVAESFILFARRQEGQFPWHASLYLSKRAGLTYICSGSLVSKHHVITAAHCVSKINSQSLFNPENFVIYLGKHYLKSWSNPGVQEHQVARIMRHPQYDYRTYSNDIAIIKLAKPAQFTDFVRPICLWEGSRDINNFVGKSGIVIGWGFDKNGKLTEELTMLKMPIIEKDVCVKSYPNFFTRFTFNGTLCAAYTNGTSICNGDSGGGMVFPKDTGNPNKKAYQLRGLVSVSVALQNEFKCDATHYVVFTDVAEYLKFIQEAMQQLIFVYLFR